MSGTQPFISIGVTTYRRPGLLRKCLESIRSQDMGDFEVWIGNDDPEGPLRAEDVGAEDPRMHLINRETNLGETANMNDLLACAQGTRFTWLADDDLLLPGALARFHQAVEGTGNLSVVYAPFMIGKEPPGAVTETCPARVFGGEEWLDFYLSRSSKVAGCYGAFDTGVLRAIGGMKQLGNGRFAPYADNLVAIEASMFDRIGYVTAPAFFLLAHEESASVASCDLALYASAQSDFLARARGILSRRGGLAEQRVRFGRLLEWCVRDFAVVARRGGASSRGAILLHVLHLLFVARTVGCPAFSTIVSMLGLAFGSGRRKR